MPDNEKLIEEARALVDDWGQNEADAIAIARSLADALEAAEKAHTPTDDEREALVRAVNTAMFNWDGEGDEAGFIADAVLAAGFRRTEVPEPSAEFPFTHDGVTLEQDDGGIWVSNGGGSSYWISPLVLAALRAAGVTGHVCGEPAYFASSAALREDLESPVISEQRKESIRAELIRRHGTL